MIQLQRKPQLQTRRPRVSGFPTMVEIRSDPSDFWECSEPSRKVASLSHTHLLRATGRCLMVSWFAFLYSLRVSWGILQESSGTLWNPQKVLLRADALLSSQQMSAVHLLLVPGRQGTEPTKEDAWGRHQLFESLKCGLRNRSTLRPSTKGKGDGVLQTGHTDPFSEWILALHT